MYGKGSKKGMIRFAIKAGNGVSTAKLAGDFNDWTPQTMRKQKSGEYVANVPLSSGNYEYKFLVNEEWLVDPDNGVWAVNPYGTVNSVAQVS